MFAPKHYCAKATEYGESLKTSTDPRERRVYQALRRHFAELAGRSQGTNRALSAQNNNGDKNTGS
jgi:hypothetical protein